MARIKADTPFLHPDCEITDATFGTYVEIGRGSRLAHCTWGDYSYWDRFADVANTSIGKFSNIAAFVRIGATDHPMVKASLHHFHYHSASYFDDAEDDAKWFAHRRTRRTVIGHDTWLGHGAQVRPEVNIGHGAVVAGGAIVTKDVAPLHGRGGHSRCADQGALPCPCCRADDGTCMVGLVTRPAARSAEGFPYAARRGVSGKIRIVTLLHEQWRAAGQSTALPIRRRYGTNGPRPSCPRSAGSARCRSRYPHGCPPPAPRDQTGA